MSNRGFVSKAGVRNVNRKITKLTLFGAANFQRRHFWNMEISCNVVPGTVFINVTGCWNYSSNH